MRGKKRTTESFIYDARAIHGARYGYTNTVYESSGTPVSIECHKHGVFLQTPHRHLKGSGCPKCGREVTRNQPTKLSNSDFIERSVEVHGNRYSYDKTVYKNALTHVVIVCSVHGEFQQTPAQHMAGRGCNKCKYLNYRYKRGIDAEEFVRVANKLHKNKYRYLLKDSVVTMKEKINIECPRHGIFNQLVQKHLDGQRCSSCADEENGMAQRKTTTKFVQQARKVHGKKYSYEFAIYETALRKITIFCPKHGKFSQTPASHLSGTGCPSCGESKGEAFIANELKSAGINFQRQWSHPTLKSKRILKFDFYLPEHRIAIEFDGLQHYEPVNWAPRSDKQEVLREIQSRDRIKDAWAAKSGIRLKRFTYKDDLSKEVARFLSTLT